jgi:hypothetical protein
MAVHLVSYDAVQKRGWHKDTKDWEAKKKVQKNVFLKYTFVSVEQSEIKFIDTQQ